MKNISMAAFITVFIIFVTGCSNLSLNTKVVNSNYEAVDRLLLSDKINKRSLFIVTTIVNINEIESSSPLGRTMSEQLTTRFVQQGIKIIEMKLRDNIYMKNETGELMLSRKVEELADEIKADYVVVGTYSDSHNVVFINLRIVDPRTNIIISTIDYELEKDKEIKSLLGQTTREAIF